MSDDIVGRIDALRAALSELQDQVEALLGGSGASRRNEDVLRAISDWVWETDANLTYVYASEGIAQVFGAPAASMEGRYLFALDCVVADDPAVRTLFETIEKRRPFRDVALSVRDERGEPRPVLLSGVPIFEEPGGQFAGYRGTGVDATRRRPATTAAVAAEAAPETAPFEPAPGYWRLDRPSGALTVADDVLAALALSPAESPKRLEDWCALVHPDDRARFVDGLEDLTAGRAQVLEGEFRMTTPAAGERCLSVRAKAVRAPGGEVRSVQATWTDITGHMAKKQALATQTRAAELANRAKTEFLAHLSHELRTPLNAIIGFSEAIKEGYLGPLSVEKSQEYASDVFDASTHLLALINDVLDISKVESGQIELSEADLDLADLIDPSVRLVEGRASEGWVDLSVEIAENAPRLRGDARFIKQILVNLLANAVKFTPKGGRVRIEAGPTEDGRIRIAVVDTGVGMAAEDIPKALSPFGQLGAPGETSRAEGTGLGLPLAKSLAELHGGELAIESEPGRGTTVTVTFPAERVVR